MPRLTKKKNFNCQYFKIDNDDLFKNRSKIPTFVIRLFLTMLDLEVDRIYLHKLEYEMNRIDYPVDYNCYK